MTGRFPQSERYGLAIQMRRAAVSIPSNLAEGYGRLTFGEMRQFVRYARGSAAELSTQIEPAANLGFLAAEEADILLDRTDHVLRMLSSLLRHLNRKSRNN